MIVEALADLRDMDVREVMTPRTDVVSLNIPVTERDVVDVVRQSGHSAYPVVHGGLDDVVGVLYVNDLFGSRRSMSAGPGGPELAGLTPLEVSRRVRQAHVVPESRPVLAALVEMRRQRRRFAIVVDEHGGVSGVLTVKDLLEPLVGDLQDELDVDEGPQIVRVDASRWIVDGQTNVDVVREQLGLEVPEGEYVTLGGYVLDALGHIPEPGETVTVDTWELTVHEMDKRRIATLLAARTPGFEAETAPSTQPSFAEVSPSDAAADRG